MTKKFAANDDLHLAVRLSDFIDRAESLVQEGVPTLRRSSVGKKPENVLSDNEEDDDWELDNLLGSLDLNRRDSGVSAIDIEID